MSMHEDTSILVYLVSLIIQLYLNPKSTWLLCHPMPFQNYRQYKHQRCQNR